MFFVLRQQRGWPARLQFLSCEVVKPNNVTGDFTTFFMFRLCYLPFQVLKNNGISGPTPSFFYGNFKEITEKVPTYVIMQLHMIRFLCPLGNFEIYLPAT